MLFMITALLVLFKLISVMVPSALSSHLRCSKLIGFLVVASSLIMLYVFQNFHSTYYVMI